MKEHILKVEPFSPTHEFTLTVARSAKDDKILQIKTLLNLEIDGSITFYHVSRKDDSRNTTSFMEAVSFYNGEHASQQDLPE